MKPSLVLLALSCFVAVQCQPCWRPMYYPVPPKSKDSPKAPATPKTPETPSPQGNNDTGRSVAGAQATGKDAKAASATNGNSARSAASTSDGTAKAAAASGSGGNSEDATFPGFF